MEPKELEQYQKLTKDQKSIVDALKILGFEWKYYTTYESYTMGKINVSNLDNISDLIKVVFEAGQIKKMHEIQNVLGL